MLVNGVHLLPDLQGVAIWPQMRLMAVSDLHLEKTAARPAFRGGVPPYDTGVTLERLGNRLRHYRPRSVVCVGETFHDGGLDRDHARLLAELVAGVPDWIWITGPRDPRPDPALGGRVTEELGLGSLTFRGAPRDNAPPGEVAGRLHPKAILRLNGRFEHRPCFATDGRRLILPAFGAYTGGADVLSAPFRTLFRRNFTAFVMTSTRIQAMTRAQLAAAD